MDQQFGESNFGQMKQAIAPSFSEVAHAILCAPNPERHPTREITIRFGNGTDGRIDVKLNKHLATIEKSTTLYYWFYQGPFLME